MASYSPHWRATIFAAIIFHVVAAVIFYYVLPHIMPAPKLADVAEFEWVDVDLADEAFVIEEEAIPQDAPQETLPTFNAQEIFVPELVVPEPVIEQPPPLEVKPIEPIEPPKPQPPPVESKPDKPKVEPEKSATQPEQNQQQLLTKPPVTVKEVYPEKGSGLGYKGYVSIAARIGKDGKVKATEIIQSSGRYFVDEIALKAARQWTFRPALDQIGRPMECDKIITFDFRKFS